MKPRNAYLPCLVLLLGCAVAQAGPPDLSRVRERDFEVQPTDGTRVPLASLLPSDRPIVVEFWATWCAPCRKLTPSLQKLFERYDSGDVTFLGLTIDDPAKDRDLVERLMVEEGVTFPVAFASQELFRFMNERDEVAVPKVLVYDANGKVVTHITSYSIFTARRVAKAVRRAMAQR